MTREGLLRKMRFPRLVIPLSVALTALFNLGTNLIAVVVFAIASGVEVRATWLEMIPLVALLAIFATGIGMLLSVLYVRFRDIQPIWEVVQQILFYGSPILYTAGQYKQLEHALVTVNPDRRAADADGPPSPMRGRPHGHRGDRRRRARFLVPVVIIAATFAPSACGSSRSRRAASPRTSRGWRIR